MPTLDERLKQLRRLPTLSALAALDASLPFTPPDERQALLAELIALAERPDGPGLAAVRGTLRNWPDLDADSRLAVAGCAGSACGDLIDPLLSSPTPGERRVGSMIAADLVRLRCEPSSPIRGRIEPALDRALARAAMLYAEHRLPEVLDALLATPSPGPSVRALLAAEGHEVHLALRTRARLAAADASTSILVRWLGLGALAPVARAAIEQRTSTLSFRVIAPFAHLLGVRTRRQAARRLKQPADLFQSPELFTSMPEDARRGFLRLIRALNPPRPKCLATWQACLTDPATLVRLDAVRSLAAAPASPEGDELLRDFALDASPAVAAAAAAALSRAETHSRRASLRDFFSTLRRSPHPVVRRIAAGASRERDPAGRSGPRREVTA